MPARHTARRYWSCGCDSHVAVECPSRHDVMGRRQDESWDGQTPPKAEQAGTIQEKGIGSILREMAEMMKTSTGEGIFP